MNTLVDQHAVQTLQTTAVLATLQKELSLDKTRAVKSAQSGVHRVGTALRQSAENENALDALHKHLRKTDTSLLQQLLNDSQRAQALADTGVLLQETMGQEKHSELLSLIAEDSRLTLEQSEKVAAFASAGIASTLQARLAQQPDSDNVEGVLRLLSETPAPVPVSRSAAEYTPGSGEEGDDNPESKWWSKLLLPMVLLALLFLASLQYCSESQRTTALTEEKDQLELALTQAEQQVAEKADAESRATTQLQTLQTQHSTALQNLEDLGSLSTDVQSLQQQLAAMMGERDALMQEKVAADELLQRSGGTLEQSEKANADLQQQLQLANELIESGKQNLDELGQQVEELTQQRDALTEELAGAQSALADMQANNEQQQSQIAAGASMSSNGAASVDQQIAMLDSDGRVARESIDMRGYDLAAVSRKFGGVFGTATALLTNVEDAASATAVLPELENVSKSLDKVVVEYEAVPEQARGPLNEVVSLGIADLTPITVGLMNKDGIGDVLGSVLGSIMDKLKALQQ